MPTYEYKCGNGHSFEQFFPQISNKKRVKCPKCGKPADRLISGGAGLVFKGSGFYITDYKRAGEAKRESKAESQSESKPESKPAEPTKKPKKDS